MFLHVTVKILRMDACTVLLIYYHIPWHCTVTSTSINIANTTRNAIQGFVLDVNPMNVLEPCVHPTTTFHFRR